MTGHPAARDTDWLRSAVDRFEKPLTLYAARFLGDAERACDVVQDTFLRLCEQDREQVEPHLAEWLFTVCRNRVTDVLRKEGRMSRLGEEHLESRAGTDPAPAEILEHREDHARILRVLDELPKGQQDVIRLKFQNGFSYKEISRISGYSVSNVGFLIHTGLKTIRTRLAVAPPASAQM